MEINRPQKPKTVKVKFASDNSKPPVNNKPKQNNRPAGTRPSNRNIPARKASGSATTEPKRTKAVPQKVKPAIKKAESKAELNRKIRTQTPANREQARRVKKVGGSIKNLEIKRRNNSSKQKFYVKKKGSNLGKLLISRLILFFIIFILMFSVVAGIFNLRLKSGGITTGEAYTLQIGEDKPEDDTSDYEPEYVEIPKESAQRNNALYIPVSALIDHCSLTVTGTSQTLRYIPRESGNQTMSFEVGSNIAKVNGTTVRMIASSFISNGKLYVPLDFFFKYADGIMITEDHANSKVTVSRMNIGYDAATDTKTYDTLGFKTFKTEALKPIPEPTDF